ncbi:MAG: Uma2 family endonuclease [Rhizobiales bacterium]|nr:Uma2 family endonuclease [Hyphomicrobiales bacterium]
MGVPPLNPAPMTIAEFLAFTDARPGEEKWELIEGEPVLHATPSGFHQRIVANLIYLLGALERQELRSWTAIPGIGVRVSDSDLPEPDVLVRPREAAERDLASRACDDIIVAFEVLSPSTRDRDLRWKRNAYMGLPSLMQYVVIAQDAVEVVAFGRNSRFPDRRLNRPEESLDLTAIEVSLPLSEIYRGTGLAG